MTTHPRPRKEDPESRILEFWILMLYGVDDPILLYWSDPRGHQTLEIPSVQVMVLWSWAPALELNGAAALVAETVSDGY